MPVPFPAIDTSGLIAGQSVSSDWTGRVWPQTLVHGNIWTNARDETIPHIQIFNESGVGFQVFMSSGLTPTYLPAGAWLQLPIDPSETGLTFTVLYVLPGITPNKLLLIYYAPGERLPPIQVNGNSPIQVGSNVVTLPNQVSETKRAHVQSNNTVNQMGNMTPVGNVQLYRISYNIVYRSVAPGGVMTVQVLYTDDVLGLRTQVIANPSLIGDVLFTGEYDILCTAGTNITVQSQDSAAAPNYYFSGTVELLTS